MILWESCDILLAKAPFFRPIPVSYTHLAIFFVKSFAVIPLLKIVIFGAILLMIVKIIRWIEILITHRVSILYMILYLCALEIMPLLVLYKMVE